MDPTTEPHLTDYLLEICGYSGIELQMMEVLLDGNWRTILRGVENTYVISEILATGKLFLYVSKIGEEPVEAFLSAMANISNLVFPGKTKND